MPFNLNGGTLSRLAAGPPEVRQRQVYPTAQSFLQTYQTLSSIEGNKAASARADKQLEMQEARDKEAVRKNAVAEELARDTFDQRIQENAEDEFQRLQAQENFESTEARLLEAKKAEAVRAEATAKRAELAHQLAVDKFNHKKAQDSARASNKELEMKAEMMLREAWRTSPAELSASDRATYVLGEVMANPNSKHIPSKKWQELFNEADEADQNQDPIEYPYKQGVRGMVLLANGNDVAARPLIAAANDINEEDILDLSINVGDTEDPMDDVATFTFKSEGGTKEGRIKMGDYVSKVPSYQGMMNHALTNIKTANRIEFENVRNENKQRLKIWQENRRRERDAANWSQQDVSSEEAGRASLVLQQVLPFYNGMDEEDQIGTAMDAVQHARYIAGTQRIPYPNAMKQVVNEMVAGSSLEDSFFFGLFGGGGDVGEVQESKADTPSPNLKQIGVDEKGAKVINGKTFDERLDEMEADGISAAMAQKLLESEGWYE